MARPNRHLYSLAAVIVMATVGATPADAQSPRQRRVEISANVGADTAASKFTASRTLASNGAENETISADHGVKNALGFDVGAAVRLAGPLWMGVQYAVTEMKPAASITAVIPHPILFNAPRTVEGSIDNLAHKEQNVHLNLMYALPMNAVDVRLMAGPTFFNLKQDFVSGIAINETYPFDNATFASATTKRLSKGAVGFNAGVDVSRLLSSHVGIGALVRYSRADVKFDEPTIGRHTVTAGGVEAAGGLRLRF